MGRVYGHAASTLAWLGPPDVRYPHALDFIVKCTQETPSEQLLLYNLPMIVEIISRPWFSRAWVVQEVALSPRCMVLYGDSRADIQDIFRFGDVFVDTLPMIATDDPVNIKSSLLMPLRLIYSQKQFFEAVKHNRNIPLLMQLEFMRVRGCSNPRDYYYGIRGLDERMNGPRPVSVDYARDVGELYTQVSKVGILERGGGMSMLAISHREMRLEPEHILDYHKLPSWVPDWSEGVSACEGVISRLFAAGGQEELRVSDAMFVENGRSLTLDAIVISAIKDRFVAISDEATADVVGLANPDRIRDLYSWIVRRVSWGWEEKSAVIEAFARTLAMDLISRSSKTPWRRWPKHDTRSRQRASPSKHAVEHAMHGRGNLIPTYDDLAIDETAEFKAQFWTSVRFTTPGRCFALTHEKHFTLCPGPTRVKDLVVVFPGVKVPWVLRRQDAKPDRYLMIGPAYVHNYMDGEAVEELSAGKYALETFVID